MDKYQTFYQPDTELSNLIQSIGVQLADWVCALSQASVLQLEALKLKSIQASLALDHNSLSLIQLQQLAAGKRVVALVQDIRQAKMLWRCINNWIAFGLIRARIYVKLMQLLCSMLHRMQVSTVSRGLEFMRTIN